MDGKEWREEGGREGRREGKQGGGVPGGRRREDRIGKEKHRGVRELK